MKKRPFTQDELTEAMAALDEEALELVAYCTTCKGAHVDTMLVPCYDVDER